MNTTEKPVDTTSRLWDYLYKVRVPYQASRTVDDIRRHGTVLTGVKEIDADIQKELMTTMLCIAKMADYYKEGVPVRVVHSADVKTIYEDISKHITAWKYRLERGVNIGDAPIDDLILLDQFAHEIYEHAKYQFTPETVSSLLAQHMNSVQRVNAHNFFNSNVLANLNKQTEENGVTRINGQQEEFPERDSMADFFRNRLINIRRY